MTVHTVTPRPETLAALAAVRAGLDVARARIGADEITSKGGADIVTGADIAAEAAITRVLRERCPAIAICGEENGVAPPTHGPYWLVDPICGTSNYAAHLSLYCTNVALIEDGQATIACVGDGETNDVSYAERGRGAFRHRADGDIALRARAGNFVGVELGGKPPYRDPAIAKLFAGIAADGRWNPRMLGTTLDFAKVASGDMAGLVLLWDRNDPLHTAAGARLVEEAGAIVTDRFGQPWTLEGPSLIAAATSELHAELLRYLT